MKKILWCLMNSINTFKRDKKLDELIYKCIYLIENCHVIDIVINKYMIIIKTPNCEVQLWNENKFYAWLSNGSVNGVKFEKIGCSNSAKYDFKECLKKYGYDINTSAKMIDFNIENVKC